MPEPIATVDFAEIMRQSDGDYNDGLARFVDCGPVVRNGYDTALFPVTLTDDEGKATDTFIVHMHRLPG